MLKIVTQFLQSARNSHQFWLTSGAFAILELLVVHPVAIADRLSRSILPQIADGAYLYGEVNRPEVIGKEYIVFEKIGNKTIGAFYLPRSEFSCFYGRFKGAILNLTLIDPFDGQKSSYTLIRTHNGLIANREQTIGMPIYQPLNQLGQIDRQILTTCKLQLKNVKY